MAKKKRFCETCYLDRKAFVPARIHIDDQDLCRACVVAAGMDPAAGEAIPEDEIPQVDPLLQRTRASESIRKEREAMPTLADGRAACACGRGLRGEEARSSGQCGPCRVGKPVVKKAAPVKEPKPKRKYTKRKPSPDGGAPAQSDGQIQLAAPTAFTVSLSLPALDRLWSALRPEIKAVAIAAALEA